MKPVTNRESHLLTTSGLVLNLSVNIIPLRRDYISLLNANTLSLDAMADLNSQLRSVSSGGNWQKHSHVQWILGKANDLTSKMMDVFMGFFERNQNEILLDKLITALIGPNTTWASDPSIVGSIDKKAKFRNLNVLANAIAEHTHASVKVDPNVALVVNNPAVPLPRRSLQNFDGTEEENKKTIRFLNDILNKSNLTQEQIQLKDTILSNQQLAKTFFGPLLSYDETLGKINKTGTSGIPCSKFADQKQKTSRPTSESSSKE